MKVETVRPTYPPDVLALSGRIGLIALSTDFNIEKDLYSMLPDDVSFFTSRVINEQPLSIENLKDMQDKITAALATILPNTRLDLIIFACTSGTAVIGSEKIKSLIQEQRPTVKTSNPVDAALAAFKYYHAKKITVITPYKEDINSEMSDFFQSRGIDVLNIIGFGFEDDTAMTFISPKDIKKLAIDKIHPDADLVFISCTALRASLVIEEIEKVIHKPVITSNQAMVWHSLALMNYGKNILGFGDLLRNITDSNFELLNA